MARLWRVLFVLVCAVCVSLAAGAQERIKDYKVDIEVLKTGDLEITEEITVHVEGVRIRRGIFRDLPRLYEDEVAGGALRYQYKVRGVQRNGSRETYETETDGNAFRIRIGDEDRLLRRGEHSYSIRYRVKNAVKYRDGFDELYWNVIAHYWQFPIDKAHVTIRLPERALPIEVNGYSGSIGGTAKDFEQTMSAGQVEWTTTRAYLPREGLTVSVSLRKGVVDGPSAADERWLWWARNGALAALIGSLLGLFGFLYTSFDRVGRDPQKPPVFARYEPPENYSPAAVHHIYHRHMSGHDALIASLMQLAVKGYIDIHVETRKFQKDITTLTMKEMPSTKADLPADTIKLAGQVFLGADDKIILDGTENQLFVKQYKRFRETVTGQYGAPYFKWNMGYSIVGIVLSVGAIAYAVAQPSLWTGWHTAAIVGLVVLNGIFMYLMPAPSRMGQKIRTEIEGFKLYLETAEKLQLNAVEVGGETPPPMTEARYEQFLPYAVALGVERPWTKHFETLVPNASDYNPGWSNMSARGFRSLGSMNSAMTHSISSGVTSAMPTSSGSGSGGGGFSGGGGGGGGGGGW